MNRPPVPLLGAGLLAAITLAACGAGQGAQTYHQHTTEDSTNETVGALQLRNVAIMPPRNGDSLAQGSDVPVTATFVNEADKADRLVSATTDAAQSVTLTKGGAEVQSIDVPPLGISANDAGLMLHGLTRELRPGQYVTITLAFDVNGRKDLLVPVDTPLDQIRPNPTATATESPDPTLGDEGQKGASAAPPVG